MVKLNATKVRQFLSSLNETERRYLELQSQMSRQARELIKEFRIDKERFCELMSIKPSQYKTYLNGSYNYSVKSMAYFNAMYNKLYQERAAEEAAKNSEQFINIVRKPIVTKP